MRLAIISDIHEDLTSLEKIIKRAENAAYDQMVCLGDISGFSSRYYKYESSRDAHACLELIREKCDVIVPGNHDFHAAKRIPLHSGVFQFPANWYTLSPEERRNLTDNKVSLHEMDDLMPNYSSSDIEYLNSLAEYHVIKMDGLNVLLSHYVYPNLAGFEKGFYTWEKEFEEHFEFMKKQNCSFSITGHGHVRGYYLVKNNSFRHYAYRGIRLKDETVCIGIPPVTRQKRRKGFCIFDSDEKNFRAYRVF